MQIMKIKPLIKNQNKWLILLTMAFGLFVATLDSTIMNVIIPSITNEFKGGVEKSEWVVSGYILSMSIMLLVSVWLSRKYGPKRLYIIGVVIFTFASYICSIAPTMNYLVAMRMLQGAGSGIITPLSISIIANNFTGKYSGLAIGLLIMSINISASLGPLIGGYFVGTGNWHTSFLINIPMGIVLTIMATLFLKNHIDKTTPKFDHIGGVLLLIWAPLSLYILSFNYQWELVAILVVVFGLFILRMLYARNPLIDINIFRNRDFALAFIVMFCFGIALQGGNYILSKYLLHSMNYTAYATGVILVPTGIVQGAIAPMIGVVNSKFGNRKFILAGLIVIIVYLYINSQFTLDSPLWHIMLAQYLKGLGVGLSFTSIMNLALSGAKRTETDSVSGVINMGKQLAGSFSIAIMTTIIVDKSDNDGTVSAIGYLSANHDGFTLLIAIIAIPIIAILLIPKKAIGGQH